MTFPSKSPDAHASGRKGPGWWIAPMIIANGFVWAGIIAVIALI